MNSVEPIVGGEFRQNILTKIDIGYPIDYIKKRSA